MIVNMNRGPNVDVSAHHQESKVFKADTIYVILKKSCYVSRSLRIQWYLQHLNTNIRLKPLGDEEEKHSVAVIVSVVPQEPHPGWSPENSHLFEYTVELSSNVIFLGEVYTQVYCLDISPSVSTVDIQHGAVLLDVIIKALRKSINYLVKPLFIPGSSHCFSPEIFITVIAHTPFYISPAQQVLVQGWKISEENLEEFLEAVIRQLAFIEDAVAQVSGTIHEQFEHERKESLVEQIELKKSTEALFNDAQENRFTPTSPNIAMVSPGSGFLNLLRYGMLALKLLPVSNFSNLVVITDGMIILPDIDTLDSVLNHMRYNDIACYFLHVGSQFHPNCGFGFVPYTEVMQLIAVATNGAYMQYPPPHVNGPNVYHQNFLIWSLKRKSVITDLSTPSPKEGEWTISNRNFYGNRNCQLLVKKYLENDINVSVFSVLACRIREGFILKDISARENELMINFVLPWTNHIYIEYTLSCQWPVVATPSISTHYVTNIKAPYEFLHDISCRMRVPIKSPFRQALIARFWRSLKSFAQSDFLLSHLESFMNNASSYYLPEILKNGMPLYNLTPGSCQPTVGSSDIGFSQFGSIWRPACLLNNNLWQEWFHTDRVGIIFKHDEPINLFSHSLSATSIQCTGMQCRQAANTLYSFLKSYCSFVLIENHSYIKFLSPNDSGTGRHTFFVIRSIFKPPYAVLHIAFLYNIPGTVRSKVLEDFKNSISALKIPRISIQKDSFDMIYGSEKSNIIANTYNSQTNCCILLDKPLEKILIRYEQMPKEFKTVVFPDGTQPSPKAASQLSGNHGLITTLSRYLHHRRWIWKTSIESGSFVPSNSLATIMSTLVKIRLQEGFYFAHYSPGICSMVLEVQMKGMWKDNEKKAKIMNDRNDRVKEKDCPYLDCNFEREIEEEVQSCIIQYVLFSPKSIVLDKEDEYNNSNVRVAELVSECWVEPQHGVVSNCPRSRNYMMNLQYQQIPDAIWSVDAKCISALLTFDYLRSMCENQGVEAPSSFQKLLTANKSSGYWPNVAPFTDQRISQIPFPYSVPNLLCQCVQEILEFQIFSIDLQNKSAHNAESNKILLDSIYNHLASVSNKELTLSGRDAQYFIRNFRKPYRCSDSLPHTSCNTYRMWGSQMSLNSNSEKSFVVPTPHDWDRMTAWAKDEMLPAYVKAKDGSSYCCHRKDDVSRRPSGSGDSRMSSDGATAPSSNDRNSDEADFPKWQCYVKFINKTFCLVTAIPDGTDLIKSLYAPGDKKLAEQTTSESSYCDADSRTDVEETASSAVARNDSCSFYASCSAHSGELNEQDELADRTPQPGSAFRLRASTWDPVRRGDVDPPRTADDRLRTNSLGARIAPLAQLRPKRGGSFDFESRDKLSETFRDVRTHFSSVILPIYVCKCSLSEVIKYLISNNDCEQCEEELKSSEMSFFDVDPGCNYVEEQCRGISEAFTKFFICSLFKSLHHGYDLPTSDIEQAFSKCETSVLTIDITDYLKVVCKHLKNFAAEAAEDDPTELKPTSYFTSSPACNDLLFIHRLTKKKFTKILSSDFKSIPSKPEFHFFFPSWTKESKPSSVGMLSPGVPADTPVGISVEQMMPPGMNTWESCKGSVNSDDNACTSLLSNMDSDSLNEVSHESLMDEFNPLFIKLECHIHSDNNVGKCPVNVIPTCICEILRYLDKPMNLRIDDLRITLNFICLTSPFQNVKKKPPKSFTESSARLFYGDESIGDDLSDCLSYNDKLPQQVSQLPDYQFNALNACLSQMKWLMKDEIVTFMLDSSPVTSDVLKMVCDHIESSPNASTCFIEKVPLSFVFGKQTACINNFLQDFDNIKIPYYSLKKEKNIYYLVKNTHETHRMSRNERESQISLNDIGRIMTSSMEVVNEEHDSFFQVFSSDESIFDTKSNRSIGISHLARGSITDGEDDNHRTMLNTVQWILDRQSSDTELPNFWLIMTITSDYVIVYFHCRFLELKKKEIEDYILVRETVIHNIKNLCKMVNQKVLLDSLHDTRLCDQLLVPDPQQFGNDDEANNLNLESDSIFAPGCFACNVVWEMKFNLHPRLKTSPLKGTVSRGIQALCSALSGFSVINRKNMFVYQDVNKNVFYLKLYESIHGSQKTQESEETSSGSFSRSSSFTSLSRKQFDEQLPFLLDETRSRIKSFSDTSDSNLMRSEDFIILKVYGIAEAGNDIKNDLVQALHNRLDDAVLDVISVMLSRNALCKLLSEDVHFIQKPNQLPFSVLQFCIQDWVMKYLYSFRYFIKQNMQVVASLPKYSDHRSSFHFQDYSVPENSSKRISEHDIFLYNQNPTSGKGIACLAFTIVDENSDTIECTDELDASVKHTNFEAPSLDYLKSITSSQSVTPGELLGDCYARVEFRIWKQGKVNMEVLESKLCLAIKHALWELTIEKILLPYPIFLPDSVVLFEVYHSLIPAWINFGTEFNVPSIRLWEISVPIRPNLCILLKELNSVLLPPETSCYAFYKKNHCSVDIENEDYTPCTNFREVMHTGDICLVIGRNATYLHDLVDNIKGTTVETSKGEKMMQRLPSVSQDDVPVMISKQKFISIVIANSKVKMFVYNWSKDKFEYLTKYVSNVCDWLQARAQVLSSIVLQKMGIFHNLPMYRQDLPKKILEITASNTDVLMKFPIMMNKSAVSGLPLNRIGETFKDVKLPRAVREKLVNQNPFEQNINQLLEIQKLERKPRYKQLHKVNQSKVSSSNTTLDEEMLSNFQLRGRLIHYCLTPLLFMPAWRIKAASTRDYSLSLRTQSQSEDLNKLDVDESWHESICLNFINDYKQYLQSLGFFHVLRSSDHRHKKLDSSYSYETESQNIIYMQRFLLGGVLLYELHFCEPFFNAKLYALEYTRVNAKNNALVSQFTVGFLDECDRIKFQMHLHSFTYDYHLRCLHQFISERDSNLPRGYHLVDFLDDFMKYYPKAPNYARSLVHTECISVNDVSILPAQLFKYLLNHGENYNMDVFCMVPSTRFNEVPEENEYVLIRNKSLSAVCYKDSNDIPQTDDFDIIIIVSRINDNLEGSIRFQVYILITNEKELYPKSDTESKLGKFRTVSTSYDYASSTDDDSMRFSIYDESCSSRESQDLREYKKKKTSHVEIKQEFVNYLGYYSSHEEAMQKLMADEMENAKKYIEWMVEQGIFDCETHLLWNKLLCSTPSPLTYQELQQLVSLADVFEISSIDPQLKNILNQPISWLQSFIKALVAKLPDSCHLFPSLNGNTQELLILHPQYSNGFVMFVLNLQKSTCTMNLVYRRGKYNGDETQVELQSLFEQIVNTYCFHLWLDAF